MKWNNHYIENTKENIKALETLGYTYNYINSGEKWLLIDEKTFRSSNNTDSRGIVGNDYIYLHKINEKLVDKLEGEELIIGSDTFYCPVCEKQAVYKGHDCNPKQETLSITDEDTRFIERESFIARVSSIVAIAYTGGKMNMRLKNNGYIQLQMSKKEYTDIKTEYRTKAK